MNLTRSYNVLLFLCIISSAHCKANGSMPNTRSTCFPSFGPFTLGVGQTTKAAAMESFARNSADLRWPILQISLLKPDRENL